MGPQLSPATEKTARPSSAPAAEPRDPTVEIVRVEHAIRRGEEKWTELDNWFPSGTLVWRERMPRWMLPTVPLATKRELLEWQ